MQPSPFQAFPEYPQPDGPAASNPWPPLAPVSTSTVLLQPQTQAPVNLEMAQALREAYSGRETPQDVQDLLAKAGQIGGKKTFNRTIDSATAAWKKARETHAQILAATKKHHAEWIGHLNHSIKLWAGHLEAYKRQQATLFAQAVQARADIETAKGVLEELSKDAAPAVPVEEGG